jgi:hypothetical protein
MYMNSIFMLLTYSVDLKKCQSQYQHAPQMYIPTFQRNNDHLTHRSRNHTLYDIPPFGFVFQVTKKDLRSSLMMAGYCRNMYEAVYRIKEWYNQYIFLVISTTSNMHGTNVNL